MKTTVKTVVILTMALTISNASFAGYQAACFSGELQILGQRIQIENIYKQANQKIAELETALQVIKSCGDKLLIQSEQFRIVAEANGQASRIYQTIQVEALQFKKERPQSCDYVDFDSKSQEAGEKSTVANEFAKQAAQKATDLGNQAKVCKDSESDSTN